MKKARKIQAKSSQKPNWKDFRVMSHCFRDGDIASIQNMVFGYGMRIIRTELS